MLQFLLGVFVGAALVVCAVIILLVIPAATKSEDRKGAVAGTKAAAGTKAPAGAEQGRPRVLPGDIQKLESAISNLKGKQSLSAQTSFDSRAASPRKQTVTAEEVISAFNAALKEARARLRDMKEIASFFTELGRVYAVSSKELSKLAERGMKHDVHEEAKELNLEETNQTLPSARWLALGKYMSTLSQDHESLSMLVCSGISVRAASLVEEMAAIEKKLSLEGQALVNKKKDLLVQFETRQKARDRHGGSEIAEEQLREANARLGDAEKELLVLLPRVNHDLHVSLCLRSSEELRMMLLQLGRKIENLSAQATKNVVRFQSLFSALHTSKEYEADLLGHLVDLRNTLLVDESGPLASIDMKIDSTASLAAALPSELPPLPAVFASTIEPESCVWFNSFFGRVYRDISRSSWFEQFLCSRVTSAISRGLPSFIDELTVTGVVFGATPPLFQNVRWIPAEAHPFGEGEGEGDNKAGKEEADDHVSCECDFTIRGGIKFILQAKVWLNKTIAASINVSLELELLELQGSLVFGCQRDASYISFKDEPYTAFSIGSEIGSHFKLKDLPQLSDYIIKRLRASIRNNLVAPKRHRFRLIWPRTWWPEGTQHLFPQLPSPADQDKKDHDEGEDKGGRPPSPSQASHLKSRLASLFSASRVVYATSSSSDQHEDSRATVVDKETHTSVTSISSASSSSVSSIKTWLGETTLKYRLGLRRGKTEAVDNMGSD